MSILPKFFRLLLTTALSFVAPVILIGAIIVGLCVVGFVPGFEILCQSGIEGLAKFLEIFGGGSPMEGVLAIGFTFALVGAIFDTYASYRYQTLRGD
ncbi:hypothetical protein IQ264_27600 [Phormidium sp. LEGE 05292]|uniref:hypothetical protein n=1 Tax=[Phormidium] sp. LEGE 05292 TaxID=767427 RepID=UPI00187E7D40|nr:hypothetical protein [Phormidium sp. LEGE 05292]MBE9229173.1 hypothetical protein [Phormidium sp. LEGE 05292]